MKPQFGTFNTVQFSNSVCIVSTEADHQRLRANLLIWLSGLLGREVAKMHSNLHRLGQIVVGEVATKLPKLPVA